MQYGYAPREAFRHIEFRNMAALSSRIAYARWPPRGHDEILKEEPCPRVARLGILLALSSDRFSHRDM